MDRPKPRKQCVKCPWKVSTDPNDIPDGYCAVKHSALKRTIAKPEVIPSGGGLRLMACHETQDLPCVGWLANQLGVGNNIGLRMACSNMRPTGDRIDANVETVGEQHQTFEETLPRG